MSIDISSLDVAPAAFAPVKRYAEENLSFGEEFRWSGRNAATLAMEFV